MKNLMICNLETIGATKEYCKINHYDFRETIKILFPFTTKEVGLDVMVNGWNNKKIAYSKFDVKDFNTTDYIIIHSLGNVSYKNELFSKIEKILKEAA